jgi:predicted transcriptional regulator
MSKSLSLSEILDQVRETEYQEKFASLQAAWGEDDQRIDLLSEALELVKSAQAEGTIGELDNSQLLDLSVALVENYMEENGASDEATDEASDEDQEKIAELTQMGEFTGALLAENGVTLEDLQKIASEDEAAELAEMCAQAYVEWLSEQEAG